MRPPGSTESSDGAGTNGVGELDWTHRIAGGLIADIARRGPYFVSDWTDAIRPQNLQLTLSSTIVCFLVGITSALSIGDAMSSATEGQLGVIENMLASVIAGLIYSTTSGQPLCIRGATIAGLSYVWASFELCSALDVEFLPTSVWQGLWCGLITVILAVTDASALMHHFTRFAEDIFSALVSSFLALAPLKTFLKFFSDDEWADDPAEVSTILAWSALCSMTVSAAMLFKHIKSTKYYNKTIRNLIADFAAPISIVIFSVAGHYWHGHVEIEFITVPESFEPTWTNPATNQVRSWFVNPMGINRDLPIWAIFLSIVPGAGLALLGFIDQNLTGIIINRPSNGLRKPVGYHLDLFVCGAVIYPICAFMGLPLHLNATALSLIHLVSLTRFEEEDLPGGGRVWKASKVVEQRFTNFAIHFMFAAALFVANPTLQLVPTAVTSGLFLIMALNSLAGNQLWERVRLWFIFDKSAVPQYYYVKRVEASKISKFTKIQFGCFLAIFLVSEFMGPVSDFTGIVGIKMLSVLFPFLLASLVLVRRLLNRVFTPFELAMLDARFEPVFADEDENGSTPKCEDNQTEGQNSQMSAAPTTGISA